MTKNEAIKLINKNIQINKISKYSFYICIIAIEYLATTTQTIEVVENSWDKANHFIAFMVLYILLSFGYKHLSLIKKIVILLAFAVQIEIVQYFTHLSFNLDVMPI